MIDTRQMILYIYIYYEVLLYEKTLSCCTRQVSDRRRVWKRPECDFSRSTHFTCPEVAGSNLICNSVSSKQQTRELNCSPLTSKCVYLYISKLHSILAVANLLAHKNINATAVKFHNSVLQVTVVFLTI